MLQVGDLVMLRNDISVNQSIDGLTMYNGMLEVKNKPFRIKKIRSAMHYGIYIDVEENSFTYPLKAFIPYVNSPEQAFELLVRDQIDENTYLSILSNQ